MELVVPHGELPHQVRGRVITVHHHKAERRIELLIEVDCYVRPQQDNSHLNQQQDKARVDWHHFPRHQRHDEVHDDVDNECREPLRVHDVPHPGDVNFQGAVDSGEDVLQNEVQRNEKDIAPVEKRPDDSRIYVVDPGVPECSGQADQDQDGHKEHVGPLELQAVTLFLAFSLHWDSSRKIRTRRNPAGTVRIYGRGRWTACIHPAS